MIRKTWNLSCFMYFECLCRLLKISFVEPLIENHCMKTYLIAAKWVQGFYPYLSWSWMRMNLSGRIPGHVNTLVHLYFCIRRSDEIIFISVGPFPFSLHCYLVPGMAHWLSVYYCSIINTRQLIWKLLFSLSSLWKAPGNRTLLLVSASSECLSCLCPSFPTWIRFCFHQESF